MTQKSPTTNPEQVPSCGQDQFEGRLRYVLAPATAPLQITPDLPSVCARDSNAGLLFKESSINRGNQQEEKAG